MKGLFPNMKERVSHFISSEKWYNIYGVFLILLNRFLIKTDLEVGFDLLF